MSGHQLDSLRIFLPYFMRQRIFLQRVVALKKDGVKPQRQLVDTAISLDPVGTDFTWEEAIKIYEKYDFEKCTLLLTFVEMVIFHSLVILLASKRPIERHDFKIYEDELANFIRTEHLQADFEVSDLKAEARELERRRCLNPMQVKLHLPPFYALDLLFKYQMYDRACDLLFYVG